MTISIRFEGFDHYARRLEQFGRVTDWGAPIVNKALKLVHSRVPQYPSPRREPQPFKTERQRRYFFWALHAGEITVPYRRSGQLGRSLTTEVRPLGNDIVGLIGTNTVYAPWVISDRAIDGRGPQAQYHAGRWWTLQQVVRDNVGAVIDVFRTEIRKLLRAR